MQVSFSVNGRRERIDVEPRRTLADALRDDLDLTGTHLGCEQGSCGACTVLMDGEPVRSCLMLAVQADGRELRTVEGLGGADGALSPLQQAFKEHHAAQCGFCTPGFLIVATALLERNPSPDEQEIRRELSGNLCRCTGYEAIVDAVIAVARTQTHAP